MPELAEDLLAWYDEHKRSLPWRDTIVPYHSLVSEVMLQQTRVDTVLPFFERFLHHFAYDCFHAVVAASACVLCALSLFRPYKVAS